jgi:hypothetical protein
MKQRMGIQRSFTKGQPRDSGAYYERRKPRTLQCAQAAIVEDPQRLLELTREIVSILTEKQRRLAKQPKNVRTTAA